MIRTRGQVKEGNLWASGEEVFDTVVAAGMFGCDDLAGQGVANEVARFPATACQCWYMCRECRRGQFCGEDCVCD